jgi:hypothetical protein
VLRVPCFSRLHDRSPNANWLDEEKRILLEERLRPRSARAARAVVRVIRSSEQRSERKKYFLFCIAPPRWARAHCRRRVVD